jgi:hypothetical protein
MKQMAKVEVGQKFRSIGTVTGTPVFTYEVQALFRSRVDQVDYARLALVDDHTQLKSIATAVLLNPRHFIPLSRSS